MRRSTASNPTRPVINEQPRLRVAFFFGVKIMSDKQFFDHKPRGENAQQRGNRTGPAGGPVNPHVPAPLQPQKG